jgi:hypothetical protein
MVSKELLNLANDMQSIGLLADNVSFAKKKKKNFVKQGVKNIIGTSFIKSNADIIGSIK